MRRPFAVVLAMATLIAVACGGSPASQSSSEAKSVGTMVIGTGIDASYASLVVGVDKGFFKKYGIDASLKTFASGQEALEAVLTGQADFTGNGQYNIPLVAAQGGKVKIVAQYETSNQQFGVAAKADIKTPQDLIGKKVATQFGTSPDYYLHLYAQHYNLDLSKITLVNLQFPQLVPALAKGDIDAFFAFEPHLTRAVDTVPGAHVLARSGDDNVMPLRVYAGVSEKVYTDSALAIAFLKGLSDAGTWANQHQDETAQLISTEFKIPIADAKRYVRYFDYSVTFDQASRDELDRVTNYLLQQKLIKTRPDLTQFIDTEFMKSVNPNLV